MTSQLVRRPWFFGSDFSRFGVKCISKGPVKRNITTNTVNKDYWINLAIFSNLMLTVYDHNSGRIIGFSTQVTCKTT